MRVPFLTASCIALALIPAMGQAQRPNPNAKPAEALTFTASTRAGDIGPIRFEVRGELDQAEVAITCEDHCNVHFHDPVGLSPQGVFQLATHTDGSEDVNLVTLWQTPSRGAVIVYNITRTGVHVALPEKTFNDIPIFAADDHGREQIVVPDDVDIGGGKTHADWVSVYTWDGKAFAEKRARWDDRFRAMTAEARAAGTRASRRVR